MLGALRAMLRPVDPSIAPTASVLREELAAWRARLLAPEAELDPGAATPRPRSGRPGAEPVR